MNATKCDNPHCWCCTDHWCHPEGDHAGAIWTCPDCGARYRVNELTTLRALGLKTRVRALDPDAPIRTYAPIDHPKGGAS